MSAPIPQRKPLIPPNILKILGIAFVVGLLLFVLLWLDQRNDNDFFRSDPDAGSSDVTALPAPLPPDLAYGDDNASGLQLPDRQFSERSNAVVGSEQPRIINEPAPAPVAPRPATPQTATGAGDRATPVPVSRPAPRYPQQALRRGIQGTVQVRATVAPDGSVERLELARGSGDRHLDRAALETVRRWRFQPAIRNGQPVSAEVLVPIEFSLKR